MLLKNFQPLGKNSGNLRGVDIFLTHAVYASVQAQELQARTQYASDILYWWSVCRIYDTIVCIKRAVKS